MYRSQTAHWNADAKDWVVSLLQKPKGGPEKQITVHAKYVVLAAGLQSIPKMPNLEVSIKLLRGVSR